MRIFFKNAISPLMVPCQAASHMNYKLFVYMWECSHQGKRPRFPCPVLNLEGQKHYTEALKLLIEAELILRKDCTPQDSGSNHPVSWESILSLRVFSLFFFGHSTQHVGFPD